MYICIHTYVYIYTYTCISISICIILFIQKVMQDFHHGGLKHSGSEAPALAPAGGVTTWWRAVNSSGSWGLKDEMPEHRDLRRAV